LLAFPRAEAERFEPFYLLIDCGVILGTPAAKEVMEAIVRDIAVATGGRIDLLVITHEHWDHISGFLQAEEIWKSNIHIEKIWMAWTEDMRIPLAKKLKESFRNDLDALRLALDRAGQDAQHFSRLAALVGLFGDPVEFAAAVKAGRRFSEATHNALNKVRELAGNRVEYRSPGESITLSAIPCARFYILGPPQNERLLRSINPSKRKSQTYTRTNIASSESSPSAKQPNEHAAFTLALRSTAESGTALPLTDDEKEMLQRSFPFEQRFRVSLDEAAKIDFFRRQYGFAEDVQVAAPSLSSPPKVHEPLSLQPGPSWRRLDAQEDWLGVARLNSKTNREKKKKKRPEHKTTQREDAQGKKESRANQEPNLTRDEAPDRSFPFDLHLSIGMDEAAKIPFFWNHYGFDGDPPTDIPQPLEPPTKDASSSMGPEWRRIDTDWLGAANELALQMDNYTNNTSLAMAIELVDSGKVLLFPADAQIGNWLSWDDISPPFRGADQKPVTVSELLRRTVFYKVGHHGSHNATMREVGLERMTSSELVAFVPVDERVARDVRNWRDMPFEPLLARLYEMTKGRVIRLDSGVVTEQMPEFLDEDVWQQIANSARVFRDECILSGGRLPQSNCGDTSLYFQLLIEGEDA
jgi:hypothetical protein